MAMKLLPKSEVLAKQAAKRSQEVDEGLRIAKRVDSVRQTLADEERSLETFRKATVSAISREIKALGEEKETLFGQVEALKRERKQLLEPVEHLVEEAKKDREEAFSYMRTAKICRDAAVSRENEATRTLNESRKTARLAADKEEAARKLLYEASEVREAADRTLAKAREVEEASRALAAEVERDLIHRDEEAAAREHSCTMREANLQSGETALANGWRLLEDRKASFERRVKRANDQ